MRKKSKRTWNGRNGLDIAFVGRKVVKKTRKMRKPNSARDGTAGPHARWKRRKRALLAFDKLPVRFISSGTNDTNNAAVVDLGWQRLLNLSSPSTSTTLLSRHYRFSLVKRTFRAVGTARVVHTYYIHIRIYILYNI